MDNIQKYILSQLVLEPRSDIETGQNKALILLLREMVKDVPSYMQAVYDANNQPVTGMVLDTMSNTPGTVLNNHDAVVLTQLQRALRSVVKKRTGSTEMFRNMPLNKINEIIDCVSMGNKLNAVKTFKTEAVIGLKEAKDIIDDFVEKLKTL